ncbi:hypothetical protein ACWGB8_21350 [Kitasatospora sp. NPDC054939]
MSNGTPVARSAYVLEKAYHGQADYSVLFVYSRREHIRALLQDLLVDHDPEETGLHFDGESADLWLVEHGRRVGHIDLHPLIRRTDDHAVVIDWAGFEAAVPAALTGPVLRHGETLALLEDVRAGGPRRGPSGSGGGRGSPPSGSDRGVQPVRHQRLRLGRGRRP